MSAKEHGVDDADQKPRPRLEPQAFSNVSAHTMHDDRLKARELRVLICITWHADPAGYAWPSQELIARETRLARQTVSEAIKQLQKLGCLTIVSKERRRGRWASNSYRVVRLKPTFEPP